MTVTNQDNPTETTRETPRHNPDFRGRCKQNGSIRRPLLPPVALARVDGRLYPMSRSVALEASRVRGDDTLRCTITDYKTKESAVYDAILAQYCNGEKPTIDCFDISSLKAMLRVRRESLVDSSGATHAGRCRKGADAGIDAGAVLTYWLWHISRPRRQPRRERHYEDMAWEFNIREKASKMPFLIWLALD